MCQACCEEWFKRKRECPECRSPVNANAPTLDISLHGMIGRLTVFCANQQAGCEWQGKLEDAEEHEVRACLYRQGAIPQHQVGCPNIPVACPIPSSPRQNSLDQHLAEPSAARMRTMAECLSVTQVELQQTKAQLARLSALFNELLDSQPRDRLPPDLLQRLPPRRRADSPPAPGAQPATPPPGMPPPLAGRLRADAPPFTPAPVPRPPLPAAGRARFRAEAPPFRPRDPVPTFLPPRDPIPDFAPLRDPAPVFGPPPFPFFAPPRDPVPMFAPPGDPVPFFAPPPPDPGMEPDDDAEVEPRSLLDLRLWPDSKDRYQMLLNSALCPVRDETGYVHRSLDHFYFAQMAAEDPVRLARILAAPSALEAREVTRGVRLTPVWLPACLAPLLHLSNPLGLLLKYSQHPELCDLLASTHPRRHGSSQFEVQRPPIINACLVRLPRPVQIVFVAPGSYWSRANRLGKLLMKVRDLIRSRQDLLELLPPSRYNGE
ncbi:hypothetical protein PAPYR_8093 [Paratrimastix pyriformis]|uniref:TRAF-type domain-containing protein n=1 Tax=Paratrimastix pyriformis TaxID=342808 RepID=A0ABQ8UBE3_9EUKA|nr:hypothetical protein PAPYR_8093 [Paratrimastix pyriformis]